MLGVGSGAGQTYEQYYGASTAASPDLSSPVYGGYSTTGVSGLFNAKFGDRAKAKPKTNAGKEDKEKINISDD